MFLKANDGNAVPGRTGDCGAVVAVAAFSFLDEMEELIWSLETCHLNMATIQTGCKASVLARTVLSVQINA